MSLSIIGAGNCNLHVSMDSPLLILTDTQGTFTTTKTVPAFATLLGATIYGQAWAPDPKANPVGIATTNAFKVRIGR